LESSKSGRFFKKANYFDNKVEMLEERFNLDIADLFNLMDRGMRGYNYAMDNLENTSDSQEKKLYETPNRSPIYPDMSMASHSPLQLTKRPRYTCQLSKT